MDQHCIKAPVFPFLKFSNEDTLLGPEMKSTGEVMGSAAGYGNAMAKAQISAGMDLPRSGSVLLTVNDNDKKHAVSLAQKLLDLGFQLIATHRTAAFLQQAGLPVRPIFKVHEGRPDIVDWIKDGKIQMVINTPMGRRSYFDELAIRRAAIQYSVPCITTLSGASAAIEGIRALRQEPLSIRTLQEMHTAIQKHH